MLGPQHERLTSPVICLVRSTDYVTSCSLLHSLSSTCSGPIGVSVRPHQSPLGSPAPGPEHTALSSSHHPPGHASDMSTSPTPWVSPQRRSLDDSAFTHIVLLPYFFSKDEDVQFCGWSLFRCRPIYMFIFMY